MEADLGSGCYPGAEHLAELTGQGPVDWAASGWYQSAADLREAARHLREQAVLDRVLDQPEGPTGLWQILGPVAEHRYQVPEGADLERVARQALAVWRRLREERHPLAALCPDLPEAFDPREAARHQAAERARAALCYRQAGHQHLLTGL